MDFRTIVDTPSLPFRIGPLEEVLFVGSCFADNMGKRFAEERFAVTANPFGTMYNPVSVLHTLQRVEHIPRIVFLTFGTNHIYRLKSTGEVVDNCRKRPASLFSEEELSVDDCARQLRQSLTLLRQRRPDVQVVLTVSPIRYRKYGYHRSQLSKGVLLLAIDSVLSADAACGASTASYFPAYEIVLDELRDYRFYQPDMLHPSQQTVDYLFERLADACFSDDAREFLRQWAAVKAALNHRPLHPDSDEYSRFLAETRQREQELLSRYGGAPHSPKS